MQNISHEVEKEVILPHVRVELATIAWDGTAASPIQDKHALFQRLSRHHSPLRIGNISAYDLLPRIRSVGFLPAGRSLPLSPIEAPLQVLSCFYDPDFVEEKTGISREGWAQHTGALVSLRNKRLEILMQDIHAELEQPDLDHEFLIESVTNVMLVELARFLRQLDRKRSRHGIVLALAPWQLLRIEKRINASPELGYPTLGELADLCGVSEGHMTRAFKVSTGWQIQKYIAQQRIKTAQELLNQGEMSCEEVSARLGFKSPSYFSTTFHRMTGRSPSEVRRQAKARHDSEQD